MLQFTMFVVAFFATPFLLFIGMILAVIVPPIYGLCFLVKIIFPHLASGTRFLAERILPNRPRRPDPDRTISGFLSEHSFPDSSSHPDSGKKNNWRFKKRSKKKKH